MAPVCPRAIDHQPLTTLEQWKAFRHGCCGQSQRG